MTGRFSRREVAVLYGIVLTCSLFFFVVGVFFGRSHQPEMASPKPLSTAAREPVEDVQAQLGFYNEMLSPDEDSDEPSGPGPDDPGETRATESPPVSDSAPVIEVVPPVTRDVPESVPVVQPSSKPQASPSFTVQVGAYKTSDEARQVVLRLTTKGYSSLVVDPAPGLPFFRVCVGETVDRSESAALAERLKADGFNTYVRRVVVGNASN